MKYISLIFIFIISDLDFLCAKTTQQLDCRKIAYQVEKDLNIPNKLLVSIALTESGTTNSLGNFVAWPWTLNVNGKPYFFNNKVKEIIPNLKTNNSLSVEVIHKYQNIKSDYFRYIVKKRIDGKSKYNFFKRLNLLIGLMVDRFK